jgi:hypothetical protein
VKVCFGGVFILWWKYALGVYSYFRSSFSYFG